MPSQFADVKIDSANVLVFPDADTLCGANGIARTESAFGGTVVFEGDSITRDDPSLHTYPYYCTNLPWFQGATIYNTAVASSTIPIMAARYTASVYPHRPTGNGGDGGPVSYLFILIGVNDIGGGASSSTMIDGLTDYTEQAIADGFTVVAGFPTGFWEWSAAQFKIWDEYCNAIANNTIPRNICWDARQFAPQSDAPGWYVDGLHPNENWQQLVAAYLNAGMIAGQPSISVPCGSDYSTVHLYRTARIDFPTGGFYLGIEGGQLSLFNNVAPFKAGFGSSYLALDDGAFFDKSSGQTGFVFRNTNNTDYANVRFAGIVGTTTNDSASAGIVGQIVSSLVASGSAVSLSTGTGVNVTSISLAAGDWDVEGNVNFNLTGATATAFSAGITLTTATVPTDGSEVYSGVITTAMTGVNGITIPRVRVSLAGTTTVYLVAKSTFTLGSEGAFGGITARRVR